MNHSLLAWAWPESWLPVHPLMAITFDVEAGATLGFGGSIETSGLLSPNGLMLVGYDAIALPAITCLAKRMEVHNQHGFFSDHLVSFAHYLNRQASTKELTQVYLDCRGRMLTLVDNLDREADAVQKRAARIPGFNGYGDVMGMKEINSIEGFVGNSRSKYFEYATEETRLKDGTLLEAVTEKGGRKTDVVSDDKKALSKAARDYAGKKKILRTGECIAFNIIKKEYKIWRCERVNGNSGQHCSPPGCQV